MTPATNTRTKATDQVRTTSVAFAFHGAPLAMISGAPNSRSRQRAEHRRAFTLIELVLAIAIMAIASAIIWPRYGRSVANYRADAAARRVAQDLKLAATWARQRSQSKLIIFNATGYSISGMRALDGSGGLYAVDLTQEPYRATLRGVDFGGFTQASFDGYGTPVTAGVIRLQSGSVVRTVTMDAAGNTSITQN